MYHELVKNSMKINGGIIRISWDTNHPEMGLQFEESPLFDKGFPRFTECHSHHPHIWGEMVAVWYI